MNKVLDLTVFQSDTLDVTMLDGSVVRLLKPSQRLMIEIISLRNMEADNDMIAVFETVNNVILHILNNNAERRVFTEEDLDNGGYDYSIQMAILSSYAEFIEEVQQRKN